MGTNYEITDIQATEVHKYLGVGAGSLSGTVGSNSDFVSLKFRTLDNIGDNFYAYITNKQTGRRLLNQADYNVTCQPAGDWLEQIWYFERQSDGWYKITSAYDGRSLDVSNYGTAPGTNVITYPYSGNTAQQWCIFAEAEGHMLSAMCTTCVLDEDAGSTNIQMMNEVGNGAQWFQIEPISNSHSWDVSGFIDGQETPGIDNYGTFDIWLDGVQVADDVVDYFNGGLKIGTKYEIRDIRVKEGKAYNGVHSGSLSGTIGGNSCFTLLDFSDAKPGDVGEPANEATLNGHKYIYYTDTVTWFEAQAFCEQQGGHLVTVTSEAEDEFVQTLCGNAKIWLGATDSEKEGQWKWITGEPFEYAIWHPDEPNNAIQNCEAGEHYLMFLDNVWNDIFGNDKYGFICEIEQGSLKLGGYLDGQLQDSISGYGTVDVYVDGALVADDVSDYAAYLTGGSIYEISDIKPAGGYSYNGIHSGELTGTVKGDTASLVLDFTTIRTDEIGEPASVIEWNGKKYAYYAEPVTWYSAKAICEKLGGHLVTVNSEAEDNLVQLLCEGEDVWAGGTDSAQEQQWCWITDEVFEYEAWLSGEPNNTKGNPEGGENFLTLSYGGWNDIEGCREQPFVCEFEVIIEEDPVIKPTLTLKAPALEFKDMIKVVAFYTAENLDDVVEMGMLTYTEKVDVVDINTAAHVIPGADFEESSGRYFSSSQGIHAKYLGDTVYLACYAKLTDGSYVYTKLAGYGPLTYAANQLKKSTDMNLKQLCAAMLNYGAAAQNYFVYNTDVLANSTLTGEQINLPEGYRSDMVASVPAADAAKQGIFANNKGFSVRKPAVSFEGAFSINYFFTPAYAPVDGITLYYWTAADFNAASVLTTANATGAIIMDGSGTGQYRGDIEGIAAKNLSDAVYVAAVYSDGTNTWTSGVLGYSIGAYCSSQATKGGTMAELAMATAVYGYHAKRYFNQ